MTVALQEFGYYLYKGQVFFNKFAALDAALADGDAAPAIDFKFHKPDLLADCTIEPDQSLPALYRTRAQRLRDEYDYLILMYSGGSDSHQALMAFLNNDVFLDEVRTCFPLKFIEQLADLVPSPEHPLGLLYEYRLAVVPGLRRVGLMSPRTKITVVDTTDAYRGDMTDWTLSLAAPRITGGLHALYHGIKRARDIVDLQRHADALNRKVAVIYGAEKPYLRLVGDHLYFFFSDAGRLGVQHHWQHGNQILYVPVMFYWGDPVIVVKQAHVIKRALETNPAALAHVRCTGCNVYVDNGIPGIDVGLIYPDWDWRYHKPVTVRDDAILPAFLGARPAAIAAERTRYYNNRYGRLATRITDEPQTRIMLSDQLTRLYDLGPLQCSLD